MPVSLPRAGLLTTLILSCALWARACEFIALMARPGFTLPQVEEAARPYQNFLATSSAPPNNDGYGLVFYGPPPVLADSQRFYATGLGTVWYGNNDGAVLDSAFARVWNPQLEARLVLGHARNGSGGRGSHPFVAHRPGRSYAFQHNGDLTDGTSRDMKEAILRGLDESGYFTQAHFQGSNWEGQPGDVDSWVDSELLFHYLLQHIDAQGGDLVRGLHQALNEVDWHGFNVREDIRGVDSLHNPRSVINFALSDGESLVVYKNARDGDPNHELAWEERADGLLAARTAHGEGLTPLHQYQLLVLPPSGLPALVANMHLPLPNEEAHEPWNPGLLQAHPNPFNPSTLLRFALEVDGQVDMSIHDLAGRRVARLIQGHLGAGNHQVSWSGLSDAGLPAASGNYVAVLRTAGSMHTAKLLLVR
jgi:hypothetical protein